MSASTALITDITSVATNGPNAATVAKAINPAGPIQGYPDNIRLVKEMLQEASILLNVVKTATDSTDTTNLGLINGVLAVLNGTSAPSTAAIADLATVYTNGPNAATSAKAINPAGPIVDPLANIQISRLKLRQAKNLITTIQAATDSSDSTNVTLLANMQLALV